MSHVGLTVLSNIYRPNKETSHNPLVGSSHTAHVGTGKPLLGNTDIDKYTSPQNEGSESLEEKIRVLKQRADENKEKFQEIQSRKASTSAVSENRTIKDVSDTHTSPLQSTVESRQDITKLPNLETALTSNAGIIVRLDKSLRTAEVEKEKNREALLHLEKCTEALNNIKQDIVEKKKEIASNNGKESGRRSLTDLKNAQQLIEKKYNEARTKIPSVVFKIKEYEEELQNALAYHKRLEPAYQAAALSQQLKGEVTKAKLQNG